MSSKFKKTNTVISLGGGAFMNKKIQDDIEKPHSIWPKQENKNLINRIKNSQKRPIAIQLSDGELNKLINKRSKIYAKANYQIKCDKLSKLEIINKIVEFNEKIN